MSTVRVHRDDLLTLLEYVSKEFMPNHVDAARKRLQAYLGSPTGAASLVEGVATPKFPKPIRKSKASRRPRRQGPQSSQTKCSQCGRLFTEPACGPTHALVAHERRPIGALEANTGKTNRRASKREETARIREAVFKRADNQCEAPFYVLDGPEGRCPKEATDVAAKAQRDAALEALRPFARLGWAIETAEAKPPTIGPPTLPEQLWMIAGGGGVVANLRRSDCLTALAKWRKARPGEEP